MFGWALTPLPKTIPQDGSTITILIDGAPVGTVNYGHHRIDIATLFPGLNNTNGAVGFRIIDTTRLSDGLHTVSWVVTDDGGKTSGIGSRYFRVENASMLPATVATTARSALNAPTPADAATTEPAHDAMAVRIREMQPLVLDLTKLLPGGEGCLSVYSGAEIVAGQRRALPAGSLLDSGTGLFTWQPGPGFLGTYNLAFAVSGCDGTEKTLRAVVTIVRSR